MKEEIINEENRLYLKYLEFIEEFEDKVCSKCKGTDLQKKRECGMLSGFKRVGCNYMTKTITNKMTPSNRVLVEMIIRNKINLQSSKSEDKQ